MTYEEIEAEASRIVASLQSPIPEHAKATLAAYMQHISVLPVTEHCPYCGGALSVEGLGRDVWSVYCPCGRSRDTLKGL